MLNMTDNPLTLVPPVGVYAVAGCGADLLINILLTILGYDAAASNRDGLCDRAQILLWSTGGSEEQVSRRSWG